MFEVGRIYNRRNEIHGPYRGQQQGGISTPKSLDSRLAVFILIRSDSSHEFVRIVVEQTV